MFSVTFFMLHTVVHSLILLFQNLALSLQVMERALTLLKEHLKLFKQRFVMSNFDFPVSVNLLNF